MNTTTNETPPIAPAPPRTIEEQLENAIKVLGLSCDANTIFSSNSRGELGHVFCLLEYVQHLEKAPKRLETCEFTRKMGYIVEQHNLRGCRQRGTRESVVYQHIPRLISELVSAPGANGWIAYVMGRMDKGEDLDTIFTEMESPDFDPNKAT